MGKKRYRSGYTSKGQRPNVKSYTARMARAGTCSIEKEMNKVQAWLDGKDPWITVPGPSSNMKYIRVKATKLWGDPKKIRGIYTREEDTV